MASSFRSGSTFIAKILGRNGLKGIDQERFNKVGSAPDLAAYLDAKAQLFAGRLFPAKLMWPHRARPAAATVARIRAGLSRRHLDPRHPRRQIPPGNQPVARQGNRPLAHPRRQPRARNRLRFRSHRPRRPRTLPAGPPMERLLRHGRHRTAAPGLRTGPHRHPPAGARAAQLRLFAHRNRSETAPPVRRRDRAPSRSVSDRPLPPRILTPTGRATMPHYLQALGLALALSKPDDDAGGKTTHCEPVRFFQGLRRQRAKGPLNPLPS